MLGFGATGEFAIGEVGTGVSGAEFIGPDKYMQALSLPVRFKPGLRSQQQAFHTFNPLPLVSFGWFGALSEPKRFKPINPATLRQDFTMQMGPSPFVATGWFSWLSEPVRQKKGLRFTLQQSLTYVANPTTVTPFAWFANLSEPVRQKKGLKTHLQREFTRDAVWVPDITTLVEGWYSPMSEPKRFLRGLRVEYQKDYWSPERVLPTPNVTVILNALEVNSDEALMAIRVFPYNPPASASVSIVEVGDDGSATSVVEV